jgi:HEAT repeat protein
VDPRVAEAVRAAIDSEEPAARREAVNAAAQLADYEAVGALIRRLEDEHPGVRDNARRALEQLSRLRLGPEVQRWRVWHELNRRWWNADWPALRRELLTGDHETVIEALRSVAGRRYRHHEIAAVVVRVLDRTEEPLLLRYACLTLAALDSRPAAAALVPLLDDPRPTVRESAHECLLRLTELDLPADAELWSARLAPPSAG